MQDLRIGVVQMVCRVGEPDANLDAIDRFSEAAAVRDVDIVCFPELCVCGYNAGDTTWPEPEPLDGPGVERLKTIAASRGISLLAGILERGLNGIVYNTQVVCDPHGVVGAYRKTHVPTTEIGTWCDGSALPVFTHHKARFGIEICYDSHFPELSTILAEKGAEILFFPHASAGGETAETKKARWLRYMPARAYDNTVYVAVCNQAGANGAGRDFAGVSFVCDPFGAVIAQAQGEGEELVVADILAVDLEQARSVPETFFRHFRRPEMYAHWQGVSE